MPETESHSGGIVHEVRWSEAVPWWILLRAAGAAFSPTVILLAFLGGAAMRAGWSACDRLGLSGPDPQRAVPAASGDDDSLALPAPGGEPRPVAQPRPSSGVVPWFDRALERLPSAAREGIRLAAVPLAPTARVADVAAAAARVGWFVLVWAIFGTAISRCVALKLAGEEPLGPVGAIGYGSRKWPPAVNAVLFVLFGILVLSVPGALLGLAMRTGWGLAIAAAVWPLVLLGAVVLAILAIGLLAGWPLMVAAVGVERADSFQAISTAFSYVYQRPLHYAFYGAVAAAVAIPATAAAGILADATAALGMWATSLGMGHDRTVAVIEAIAGRGSLADTWAARTLQLWNSGLTTLLGSFGWGYFWALATAGYLVLRKDVDGTELDDLVLDEPGAERA